MNLIEFLVLGVIIALLIKHKYDTLSPKKKKHLRETLKKWGVIK